MSGKVRVSRRGQPSAVSRSCTRGGAGLGRTSGLFGCSQGTCLGLRSGARQGLPLGEDQRGRCAPYSLSEKQGPRHSFSGPVGLAPRPLPSQPAACSWGPGLGELWVGGEEKRVPPPHSLPWALLGMGSSLRRGGAEKGPSWLEANLRNKVPRPHPKSPSRPAQCGPGSRKAWLWGRPRNGCERSQPGSRAWRWQGRAGGPFSGKPGGVGVTLSLTGWGTPTLPDSCR